MSLLQMSVTAAVMIAAVTIVRALTINRLRKRMFIALWGVVLLRLLLPFSWPSPFSIYSLVNNQWAGEVGDKRASTHFSIFPAEEIFIARPTVAPAATASLWAWLWVMGASLSALYFLVTYIKCIKNFGGSIPVKNAITAEWRMEHKCRRPISIRQSGNIAAPLTYGIFHPTILMPLEMDWADTKTVQYVLAHEYIHIRHFDGIIKLLLTVALCIHWFNPLVWAMYIFANRDIELYCDESVVCSFGVNMKSAYALALISMEEQRSGLTPFCNSFSKNALEERIESIMKTKKRTLWSTVISVVIILSVASVFATSASATGNGESQKVKATHDSEYIQWGIDIRETSDTAGLKTGETAYFYENERVRIFMDIRADGSFEYFFADDKGTVDICFERNFNGLITRLESIDKKLADTILFELDVSPWSDSSGTSARNRTNKEQKGSEFDTLARLSKDDLSSDVLSVLNDLPVQTWYSIKDTGAHYIYFNGLQFNFAYQFNPNETTVDIIDFGEKCGNYVLLAMPNDLQLTFTYNSKPIVFTQVAI